MAFGNGYTFGFAFAICIVCSSALATVSLGLKDRQEANARRDLQKNILLALDLPEKDKDGERPTLAGDDVDKLWSEKVDILAVASKDGSPVDLATADLDKSGAIDAADFNLARAAVKGKVDKDKKPIAPAILGLFVRKDNKTVAIPMVGKGLWGPISGYVAFDPKITAVKGATFFAPKETPGLGALIVEDAFEAAWVGKKVVDNGKTRPIRVLKDPECKQDVDPYCVDGASGATITSRGVDSMVSVSLAEYEPYIQTVR